MRVTLIGCPFQTSYGEASESLLKALEKKTGFPVEWVASNCGCGDNAERTRQFQMPREKYKYFDMFAFSDVPSPQHWKNPIKFVARKIVYRRRAQKYRQLSTGAHVVNFQQTLSAYGSNALFYWLNKPAEAARVVTVHELDRLQLANPYLNRAYNNADAIIVQQGPLRDKLVGLGVDPGRIEIVLHGTDLPVIDENQPRDGIITYCGHHPSSGKGLHGIFDALALLKTRLGPTTPKLTVHGYYSDEDQAVLKAPAAQLGLEDHIAWLNQVPIRKAFSAYQSSLLCVLPYMGSFAGLAAATAAAAGVPVIGTRSAGILEHLGENAIWIKDDNAEEIAAQIEKLLASAKLRRDLSRRVRRRAEQHLTWDTVADNTLAVYQRALKHKGRAWA
jgi:glycosyltransferase involved in cell wall biosynthesis